MQKWVLHILLPQTFNEKIQSVVESMKNVSKKIQLVIIDFTDKMHDREIARRQLEMEEAERAAQQEALKAKEIQDIQKVSSDPQPPNFIQQENLQHTTVVQNEQRTEVDAVIEQAAPTQQQENVNPVQTNEIPAGTVL